MPELQTEVRPILFRAEAKVRPYSQGTAEKYLDGYMAHLKENMNRPDLDSATALKGFLENEVELLWEVRDDLLCAGHERAWEYMFAGRWKDHSPDLQVRICRTGIALARQVEPPACEFFTKKAYWSQTWYDDKNKGFSISGGSLSVNELIKAAGLATEFVEKVESYLPTCL